MSDLAKNSNGKNIADVLNALDKSLDMESANKLKDMFVKNAGAFYNLVNNLSQAGLRNLELRPYLLDSISATAKMLQKERSENFGKLADDIQTLLRTTDENGTNIIVQNIDKDIYKNLISDLLGASLARFVRLENPAKSLYEVLRDTKSDLEGLITPTFFKEGKPLSQADIYDFIDNYKDDFTANYEKQGIKELDIK